MQTRITSIVGSVSIVVPVYNGAQSVPELVSQLRRVMESTGRTFEILLVNDGSDDDSWSVIRELASTEPSVRGLDLLRNYGQHNALLVGIRSAVCDIIVTMDDDLQHPPEAIPALLERIAAGQCLVYAVPEALKHSMWRNLAASTAKTLMRKLMGMQGMTETSPFRAFSEDLRNAFESYNGPYVDVDALLGWATAHADHVVVNFDERRFGVSAYSASKLVQHTINMVTNFSVVPLRLANYLGFLATLFGVAVLVYVVGRFFIQDVHIPGFAFLASIITIFAGVQLFSLGIIGEYVIRMHFRMMGQPTAVVRSDTRTSA